MDILNDLLEVVKFLLYHRIVIRVNYFVMYYFLD